MKPRCGLFIGARLVLGLRRPRQRSTSQMNTRLPSAEEINVFDSLDERTAVEHFLGKDLEQAEALFREDRYWEDLMWMGPIAFRFYVPAAINYLLSEEAENDAYAASSFCSLIGFRLDHKPAEVVPVGPVIREGIIGVLKDFDRYGPDIAIFGDVAGRYRALLSRLDD
jgi:hypothetical protein